eukprot:6071537-Pleurochrysis_carterae.AAC.1
MIGKRNFGYIEYVLRLTTGEQSSIFEGLGVLLCVDHGQLPTVLDKRCFDSSGTLDQSKRRQGNMVYLSNCPM